VSDYYDPRDYAETADELARDVLDPQEYREWVRDSADRARLRNLARRHREERLRPDPWGGDAA
jgi:hypothetical protein